MLDVRGVADLADFAVTDDVNTRVHLSLNNLTDLSLDGRLMLLEINGLVRVDGEQTLGNMRTPGQAAYMSGQNTIGACPHRGVRFGVARTHPPMVIVTDLVVCL